MGCRLKYKIERMPNTYADMKPKRILCPLNKSLSENTVSRNSPIGNDIKEW